MKEKLLGVNEGKLLGVNEKILLHCRVNNFGHKYI